MSSRIFRLIALFTVLSICVVSSGAQADTKAGGQSITVPDDITTTTPDVLVATTIGVSTNHDHTCVVNASADAYYTDNSGGGELLFGLSMDTTSSTVAGSNRRLGFTQYQDPLKVVSTTYAFKNVKGPHTFYFSARKSANWVVLVTILSSSITVVCTPS